MIIGKRRQSGAEWLDNLLTEQMVTELTQRGADISDPADVRRKLAEANFGAPAIERLADRAAQAAQA